MGLNASDTPDLIAEEPPTGSSPGHTLYLKIDLNIDAMKGKPVVPMTAVFAPDPKQIKSSEIDVILWLHGDKKVWSRTRKGKLNMSGSSVQDYLKVDECKLREFILKTTAQKFLLVVPTLNDHTGSGPKKTAGGYLWEQKQAEAYLQQVLNGVKKHMGKSVTSVRNLVLAAHSGGGHILSRMVEHFTGTFDKANEVWCFDCTYWGGSPFTSWAKKGRTNPRLWVYSTGKGNGATGDSANSILSFATTKAAATTNVDVLIDDYPKVGTPSSTKNFIAAFGGSANGHYECIEKYLPKLVASSKTLK